VLQAILPAFLIIFAAMEIIRHPIDENLGHSLAQGIGVRVPQHLQNAVLDSDDRGLSSTGLGGGGLKVNLPH